MDEFRFSPRPNRANEIHWREWGEDAFQEAQRLDRPVLLAISAVWCHWCHVMDETSYSDPRVIALINRDYVPVRVDNDRHPELNQRYNMGGWPSTAFLTPQGDILTGATYLPADGFLSIASQVLEYYRTRKAELYSRILDQKRQASTLTPPAGVPADVPDAVRRYLEAAYDHQFGGFGTEPKFPQADALEFLIEQYYDTADDQLHRMISTTLQNMAGGGMFDQVAGGFFRYSTNRDWSIPHYEKMSEDNAALLRVYLHAIQALGPKGPGLLLDTAARVVEYVLATLYDPQTGAFFGSQDADEEYYPLDPAGRSGRPEPLVDRTVYTPWSASMSSAMLEASRALDRPDLEKVALRSLEFLWTGLHRDEEGMFHYYDGEARGSGLLVDQAWVMASMLDAYEATGRPLYLDRALSLARLVLDRFQDPAGGFFDLHEEYHGPGRLSIRDKSIVENCLTALGLLRLYHLTGEKEYQVAAEGALRAFGDAYLSYGPYAASYARAAAWLAESSLRIEITGDPDHTAQWRRAALELYHPRRLVVTRPAAQNTPMVAGPVTSEPDGSAAYVCYRQTCSPPVKNSAELATAVAALISGEQGIPSPS